MVRPSNETARKTATIAQARTWGKAVPLRDWRTDKSLKTLSSGCPGWAIGAASDVHRMPSRLDSTSHVERTTWRSAEFFDRTRRSSTCWPVDTAEERENLRAVKFRESGESTAPVSTATLPPTPNR